MRCVWLNDTTFAPVLTFVGAITTNRPNTSHLNSVDRPQHATPQSRRRRVHTGTPCDRHCCGDALHDNTDTTTESQVVIGRAARYLRLATARSRVEREAATRGTANSVSALQPHRAMGRRNPFTYKVFDNCSSTCMMAAWLPQR